MFQYVYLFIFHLLSFYLAYYCFYEKKWISLRQIYRQFKPTMHCQFTLETAKLSCKSQTLNILENLSGIRLHAIHLPGGFYSIWGGNKNSGHWTEGRSAPVSPNKTFIISASLRSKIDSDELLRIFMAHFLLLPWVRAWSRVCHLQCLWRCAGNVNVWKRPIWTIFFTCGGKRHFLSFLETWSPLGEFYFSHLWNRLRVHAVVSFPLNSTVRRMKVTESADSPLPLDLRAAMTTGSDGHCRRAACWFLIQKRNGPLAPGKRWHADRARSRKWQENPVSLPRRELFILFYLAGGGGGQKLRLLFLMYLLYPHPPVKGEDIKDTSTSYNS